MGMFFKGKCAQCWEPIDDCRCGDRLPVHGTGNFGSVINYERGTPLERADTPLDTGEFRGPTASPARVRPAVGSTDAHGFPLAIQDVMNGARISRVAWEDDQIQVFLLDGLLRIRKAEGTVHPLIVSDGDLYATDWFVVRG